MVSSLVVGDSSGLATSVSALVFVGVFDVCCRLVRGVEGRGGLVPASIHMKGSRAYVVSGSETYDFDLITRPLGGYDDVLSIPIVHRA